MEVDLASVDNAPTEVPATSIPSEETEQPSLDDGVLTATETEPIENAGEETRVNGGEGEHTASGPEQKVQEAVETLTETPEEGESEESRARGVKRRASRQLSSEEFRGFTPEESKLNESSHLYTSLVDSLSAEIAADEATLTPVRQVAAPRVVKRLRTEDHSRSSSSLSHRSDQENASSEVGASSPASARGRRVAPDSPQYRVPLDRGWKRELVYRAALDPHARRNADIYYYSPSGKKLRSTREVADHIAGSGLTLDNFTFFKEPIGVDDPEKETIRYARVRDSPQASPAHTATPIEGKRTPKPKPPKGASPEYKASSMPLKLKVKSQGSRLSGAGRASTGDKTSTPVPNAAAWKKPSAPATPNGDATPQRRRGRQATSVDRFTPFYKASKERKYDVVHQIFQYLGMRDLARSARVCRLWRELAATPSLWRHVRMKNSQVSDWKGLCAALARRGTQWLDLRKMLLPQNDEELWKQFAENIATVESLERLELCRCPASVVEAACRGLGGLRQLSALAVRDSRLDPAPLATLSRLRELRIKSMSGLTLTSDLTPLANLKHLQHLSLTSIKELGGAACGVVISSLRNLLSLELGECTFGAEFGSALAKLTSLQRLRLERGTADCDAPALLRALSGLPALRQLELVNFDVKPGFDEALGQCHNIQRLLIIPTYVSQSATTNKQVLSGVIRLKETLTHLMWGVTIELLRVTELFIDQCEGGIKKSKLDGQSIPVLKPVPGYSALGENNKHAGPPQVEILPLPTLQALLTSSLPNTKLKLLRIPFHATWRQSLADFQ